MTVKSQVLSGDCCIPDGIHVFDSKGNSVPLEAKQNEVVTVVLPTKRKPP